MKKQIRKLNDESGVTLVELLAAIAILSIIVTAFLGFFIQAAKTNQHTNKVNEATFLAQEQMEEIIHLSEKNSVESVEALMGSEDYPANKNGYTIVTDIKKLKDSNLYRVVIIVNEGGKDRAQMENILSFKAENEADPE